MRADRGENRAQTIGRVRIVDDNRRGGGHRLHSSGNAGQRCHRVNDIVESSPEGTARGECARRVVHRELAEERRQRKRAAAPRRDPHTPDSIAPKDDVGPAHGAPAADGNGFDLAPDRISDRAARGIVGVDDGNPQARPEELLLGGGVSFHGTVVVQMVAAQVREDTDIERQGVDPTLIQGVRADLHGSAASPLVHQRPQSRMQRDRIIGGQCRCTKPWGFAPPEGTDIAGEPVLIENLSDVVRHGGLSVGAGDADQLQFAAGRTVEPLAELAQSAGDVGHNEIGDPGLDGSL